MGKHNVPVHGRTAATAVIPDILRQSIHDIPQSFHGNAGLGHIRNDTSDPPYRQGHQRIIGQKGDHTACREFAAHTQDGAKDRYCHVPDCRDDISGDPEGRQHPHQADPVICIKSILLFKALPFEFLPSESPHHTDTGQVLLGNRGQVPFLSVHRLKFLSNQSVKDQRADDHDRDKDRSSRCQNRLDRDHKIKRHKDKDKDMQKGCELLGDKYPDGLDIRCAALDDISRAVLSQPGIGKGKDLPEQFIPCSAQKEFGPFLVAHFKGIAAKSTRKSGCSDCRCRKPQILPQKGSASQPRDHARCPHRDR